MRTGIYASAKGAILGQTLNLLNAGIKAMALNASYSPDYENHQYLSSVPAPARVTAGVTLANKTLVKAGTGYKYDADDAAFSGVPNPSTVAGVLLYLDSGNDASSQLIGYFDYFSGAPFVVTSGNVTFQWPAYGIFVLDDGVLGGPQGVSGALTGIPDPVNGVLAKASGTTVRTAAHVSISSDGILEIQKDRSGGVPNVGDLRVARNFTVCAMPSFSSDPANYLIPMQTFGANTDKEFLALGGPTSGTHTYNFVTGYAKSGIYWYAGDPSSNGGDYHAGINIIGQQGSYNAAQSYEGVYLNSNVLIQSDSRTALQSGLSPFGGGKGYLALEKRGANRTGPLRATGAALSVDPTSRHPIWTIDNTDTDLMTGVSGAEDPVYLAVAAASITGVIDIGDYTETVQTSGSAGVPPPDVTGFTAPVDADISRYLVLHVRNGKGVRLVFDDGAAASNGISIPSGLGLEENWTLPNGSVVFFCYMRANDLIETTPQWVPVAWNAKAQHGASADNSDGLVVNLANANLDLGGTDSLSVAAREAKLIVFTSSVTLTADRKVTLPQPVNGGDTSSGSFGMYQWLVRNDITSAFKLTLVGHESDTGGFVAVLGSDNVDNNGKRYGLVLTMPSGCHMFSASTEIINGAKQISTSGAAS